MTTYLVTGGNGTCWLTTSIEGVLALMVLGLVGGSQDASADIGPGTRVEGFLLQMTMRTMRMLDNT